MLLQLDELEKGGQVKDINKYITSETAGTRRFSFMTTPHLIEVFGGFLRISWGCTKLLPGAGGN